MRVPSWAGAVTLMAGAVLRAQPTGDVEARVAALLARMTLDEKIGQMSQSTSMASPLSDKIKAEIRAERWGSFLNAGSPADRAEAQRIATTETRLKIPLLFGRDVIHGYKTIFPIPLGQAATWDPDMVQQAAREAAREAGAEGIRWTFAPMIDIARDPRWGRIAESLGEDPYLASRLGVAMVHGFQGNSLADPLSLAACAKHFAGYGAAEAGRDYNSAWIPELLLREVYLEPFRAVREAGIATFMTAFEALNGVPASGNRFLLHDVLREEWKYDGLVVSDYEAVTEMIRHGYAQDSRDAAREAIQAGVDMEMVSTAYFDHLKQLLQEGTVKMAGIDEAVRRILRLKFRLGLFDLPIPAPREVAPGAESRDLAEKVALASVVLLKNSPGILPLAEKIGSLAVIGPLADSPLDQIGTWSMDGRASDAVTPLAALRNLLGNDRVHYAPGLKKSLDLTHDGFAAAAEAARQSDAIVLFLGEEENLSGEARSRAFLDLPGAQEALFDAVSIPGKPLIAVIMAGRPLTFHKVATQSGAVLFAWHPGTMGGPAIAKLLLGRASPSGRLPITFPRTVGQVPLYYSQLNTGRPALAAELGIPLGTPVNPEGYTSKYIDVDFTPAFPFGFGLTYTKFDYTNLRISAPVLQDGGKLTVTADVANHGAKEGTETVQFYIRDLVASVVQPVRKLRGFQRIALRPGETRAVSFTLTTADLTFYNQQMRRVTEPGRFQVWIAPDATSGVTGEFSLK